MACMAANIRQLIPATAAFVVAIGADLNFQAVDVSSLRGGSCRRKGLYGDTRGEQYKAQFIAQRCQQLLQFASYIQVDIGA